MVVLWAVSLLHQFKLVCNSLESICIYKMLTEILSFVQYSSIPLSC